MYRRASLRLISLLLPLLLSLLSSPLAAAPPLELVEPDLLLDAHPNYRGAYQKYKPDAQVLRELEKISGAVEVLAFYGTWCRDSRREIPRLLKVVDSLKTDEFYVQLIPLNKSKKRLDAGRALAIARTPTLVLYINGREVGRIEEKAKPDTEREMLRILKARKFRDKKPRYPGPSGGG